MLLIPGCSSEGNQEYSPVLARVGDHILTLDEALDEIPEFLLQQDSVSSLRSFQENWIENRIRYQEAIRLDLNDSPDFIDRMDRLESQILQQILNDHIVADNSEIIQVTRDEAQDYYLANRDQFVLNERFIRFRHLSARTRVDAESARTDLMRGISWVEVANQYSVSPAFQIRESESFFPISGALSEIPLMHDYLERIGVTELSPVHEINGQFHFVQLIEARDAGEHPDLEWLLDQITDWLRLEKTQRVINTYIRNLYLQAEANNEIERSDVETVVKSQTDGVPSSVN